MPTKIKIILDGGTLDAELFDNKEGLAVSKALPIKAKAQTWGDEFYFEAGLALRAGDGLTTDVNAGDLGYWPEGDCLCVFFGPTPMSTGDKPVPASGVFIVGRLISDPALCKPLKRSKTIKWEEER